MGIKGIYGELGPGRRVSLSKLAAESFETSNRPLRIAIDVAIWQFQTQAARGGTNPAIRTLFYRLVRFLGTPIQPIFVFDGPNKPAVKRNKRSGRGDGVANALAKRLIRLFGFMVHDAPGEAEAECALLQRHGIVDAVLSEDVDTIMFGCTKTLRNWSAESKTAKTPTHVSLFDIHDDTIIRSGLNRAGMVLVALMSGGDYLPDGIPGCGVKVACEAAKAGYGETLCSLKASDEEGIRAWRDDLIQQLRTNDKGHFRTKHKALVIPDEFPNLEVLRYYTHPVVSPQPNLDAVRHEFARKRDLQLEALREFTRETFDWDFRIGAIKFIRVLGQALLVRNILQERIDDNFCVKRITGRRQHFSTDATPELRLSYIPSEVVPIDLDKEVEEQIAYGRDGLALNSDDEFEAGKEAVEMESQGASVKVFDVAKPDLAWVLEQVVRTSAPALVQEWEQSKSGKSTRKSPTKTKSAGARSKKASGMPRGALDAFVRVSKSSATQGGDSAGRKTEDPFGPSRPIRQLKQPDAIPSLPPLPQQSSKQPSPRVSKHSFTSTTAWTIESSPITPRLSKPANRPETILLSSSPIASPPRLQPTQSKSTSRSIGDGRGSTATFVPASQGLNQRPSTQRNTTRQSPGSAKILKQASLDAFVSGSAKQLLPIARQPETSSRGPGESTAAQRVVQPAKYKGEELSDDSEFESLSSLLTRSRKPNQDRQTVEKQESSLSSAASTTRKKKLLVPRAIDAGFFDEVEVDAEERDSKMAQEAKSLESRGVRSGVVRWSDVSIIDLTED
ncbi:hypothetical protein HIM_01568 [Hirsutella minnesotensis 3608]|nr:hypothetical protein HIM_01568 [Hirsutella minnesotensis 3608]